MLISTVATNSEAEARRRAAFAECRDEALSRGIDLDDFGTKVTVADFEKVRQALGVARWNGLACPTAPT